MGQQEPGNALTTCVLWTYFCLSEHKVRELGFPSQLLPAARRELAWFSGAAGGGMVKCATV